MSLLDKTIDELLPTDRVIIRLGAKTQRNEANGKDIIIDPEKDLDVLFAYYDNLINQKDEFDHDSQYCPPLGRTVHLIGLASYETKSTEMGDNVAVAIIVPFATEASRRLARQQAALAEQQRQQEAADQQVRIEAEARANVEAQLKAEAEAKAANADADREVQKAKLRAELEAELAEQIATAQAASDKAKGDKLAADKAKAEAKRAEEALAKKATEEAK